MPEMEQPINTTTANTSNWDKVGEGIAFDETEASNLENLDQAVIQEDAMATGAEAAEAAMAAADLANSVPMPTDNIEETQFDEVAATNLEGLEQAEIQEAANIAMVEENPSNHPNNQPDSLPGNRIEGPSAPETIPKTDLEQVDDIIKKYADPQSPERAKGNPDDVRALNNTVNLFEEIYDTLNNSEQPSTMHNELMASEQKYDRIAKRYENRGDTANMQHYNDLAKLAHDWAERTKPITSADVPVTETVTNETTTVETPAPEANTAPTATPQPEAATQPENPQPPVTDQSPDQSLTGYIIY